MPESGVIDKLPIRNYLRSRKPREMIHFVGERSGIRLIDYKDRPDMQRTRDIENILPEEILNKAGSDKELITQVREGRPDSKRNDAQYQFGVAGLEGVDTKEIGELQGWISFNASEDTDVLVKNGIIPPVDKNTHVLEVMYAKHPDAPSGQMTSALRQASARVWQMDGVRNDQDLSITEPQLVIYACIKPDYTGSIHMAEEAGFVNKGLVTFHDEIENPPEEDYLIFVLDKKKLNDIMHQKADVEILKAINK